MGWSSSFRARWSSSFHAIDHLSCAHWDETEFRLQLLLLQIWREHYLVKILEKDLKIYWGYTLLYCNYHWKVYNWATTWQNQKKECAPSEDSDQPGHPPSLIRVFAVRMKKAWVLSYPLSAQRRLWSDWADAQADLILRWAYTHLVLSCRGSYLISETLSLLHRGGIPSLQWEHLMRISTNIRKSTIHIWIYSQV